MPKLTGWERLRLVFGSVALGIWVISFFADLFFKDYDAPQSIQLVVLIVAGSLFAPTIVRKVNGLHPSGKKEEP